MSNSAKQSQFNVFKTTPKTSRFLDLSLFIVNTIFVVCIVSLSIFSLFAQYTNYGGGINSALEEENHALVLIYSGAWDFAVVKTSSLFLAFLLVFSGSLYILKTADKKFSFFTDDMARAGQFEISFPGLAMILLGVLLIALTLFYGPTVDYSVPVTVGDTPSS